MPRRLTEEEKKEREMEKVKRKEQTAEKRREHMTEMNKKKVEEVKQLKSDLKECHQTVAELKHPRMLPVHTIEALRRIEEETMKRNEARRLPIRRNIMDAMEMMAMRKGMTREQYEAKAREQSMRKSKM